ncbi:MAG: hypothetical protein ACLVJ4_03280 [Mediterraneibacter sp.]
MTQEEYEQEQREIERLVNQINSLIAENNRLIAEIQAAVNDVRILEKNVRTLHGNVERSIRGTASEITANAADTRKISEAIEELTRQYFTFKTLSTASKNLSQYTDEYYTRFSNYHQLRRITLGYVIGLDTQFVTADNMRKVVEKEYLQNTEYWLAYASAAVMLWASNEEEAAKRAVGKALFMNPTKAALFFMLINLRFGRLEPAQSWFTYYMERVNPSDLGEEWKYLLLSYLSGAFGQNEQFQDVIASNLKGMLAKTEATTVDFGRKFSDRAYEFARTYLHQTKQGFSYLKRYCTSYQEMENMLTDAEKNSLIAERYGTLLDSKEETGEDIAQRIENVLYALVNSYDDAEFEIVKKIRYNDAVLTAQGDVTKAQQKYDQEFGGDKKMTFGDLLAEWAFSEDTNLTPGIIQKFSISFMKDWILKGYEKFAQDYRAKEKESYTFNVDGCEVSCSEDEFSKAKKSIETYFDKNRWKNVFSDKFVLLYILLCACGILTLGIMTVHFSKIALTIGILLVIVGAFLLWRRIADLGGLLQEKKRLAVQKIEHCLEELREWRNLLHQEDARSSDLEDALSRFGNEME